MPSVKYDLPLLPLRDVVVFPGNVTTLFVGREPSINALNQAMAANKKILLGTQIDGSIDNPSFDEIYKVQTLATILQLIKLPDGTVKLLVEGDHRCEALKALKEKDFLKAQVKIIPESQLDPADNKNLCNFIKGKFGDFIKITKKVAPEVLSSIDAFDDVTRVIDSVASHLPISISDAQSILECEDLSKRADMLISLIQGQIDAVDVDKKIRDRVKKQMEKSQREYYLNEQIKAAQKELGDITEEGDEISQLETQIKKSGMPKEALKKAMSEFSKFKLMSPMSAEASVVRSYLDWVSNLPWKKKTKIKSNIKNALSVLDNDHYGLEEIKERILEYLAVQKRVKNSKHQCFVWLVLPELVKHL